MNNIQERFFKYVKVILHQMKAKATVHQVLKDNLI